jgi:hypothetical protein
MSNPKHDNRLTEEIYLELEHELYIVKEELENKSLYDRIQRVRLILQELCYGGYTPKLNEISIKMKEDFDNIKDGDDLITF